MGRGADVVAAPSLVGQSLAASMKDRVMERGNHPVQSDRPARTLFWRGSLLAVVSLGVITWLLVRALMLPAPQDAAVCGMPPCVVATLPPAEVVMLVPPGAMPEAPLPNVPPPPGSGVPVSPVDATAPSSSAPPAAPSGEGAMPEPASVALAPLAEIEVAKRPEPKKPRDILLPGEVMRPERQNAAPTMGAYGARKATSPAPAPLKPLRPADKAPPRPYTVTTTRPTGAVGIRLGPCGPAVPRYQVDGVEVDAFGRPCGPS